MTKPSLTLFGSTGSIGSQALDILRQRPDLFTIHALTANGNAALLAKQANEFRPSFLGLAEDSKIDELKSLLQYKPVILSGKNMVQEEDLYHSDLVLNALVGFSGFVPTMNALKAGKRVALANKESLVVGGELICNREKGLLERIVPVDSEHSAMLQCLVGESMEFVKKIIITASGGPFRTFSKEKMERVTVEDALKHPNWTMGSKITIDSATMMNKGLEIIEAYWLYDLPVERIEPVIHPQSIIHSVIEFTDGSSKAQLGPPDMKVPILYALTYPTRIDYPNPVLEWSSKMDMTFEPVDHARFPAINLAVQSIKAGGFKPAILNAANEVAVAKFLNREIRYIDIPSLIAETLTQYEPQGQVTYESLIECDREAREVASKLILY